MLSAAEPRGEDQLIGCDARWQQVLLIGHVRAEAQSTLQALSEHKAFWENSRGPLIDTANNGQIMTPCTDSLTETRPKDSKHTHRETRTINITHRSLSKLCILRRHKMLKFKESIKTKEINDVWNNRVSKWWEISFNKPFKLGIKMMLPFKITSFKPYSKAALHVEDMAIPECSATGSVQCISFQSDGEKIVSCQNPV